MRGEKYDPDAYLVRLGVDSASPQPSAEAEQPDSNVPRKVIRAVAQTKARLSSGAPNICGCGSIDGH